MSSAVDREQTEAERDFLLRSLDDLDTELAAGNIDPDTYRTLHDDYTARAAAVVRSLDDGVTHEAPGPKRLRAVTAAGSSCSAFSWRSCWLARSGTGVLARRRRGTTTLRRRRRRSIRTATTRTSARRVICSSSRTSRRAIEEYSAAATADRTQPEPLAYRGWISALVAAQLTDKAQRATLTDRATKDLDKAIALDPKYLDAYFFKGYMLFAFEHRPADAVAPLQRFLLLAPTNHPLRQRVLDVLDDADKASRQTP